MIQGLFEMNLGTMVITGDGTSLATFKQWIFAARLRFTAEVAQEVINQLQAHLDAMDAHSESKAH